MPNGGSVDRKTRSDIVEARTQCAAKHTMEDEVQTLRGFLSQARRLLGTGEEHEQMAKLLENQEEMKRYGD